MNTVKLGMIAKAVVALLAPAIIVVAGAITKSVTDHVSINWSETLLLALVAALGTGASVFAVKNKQAVDYEPVQTDYDAENNGVGASAPNQPVEPPEAGL